MQREGFHHTWVVSPVGTSLLTNGAWRELGDVLRRTANLRREEFSREDLALVEARVAEVEARLAQASEREARKMSAELNGILTARATGRDFSHYLLCTDTFQGMETGRLVMEYLRRTGVREASLVRVEGLSTASQEAFGSGVDFLLRWCDGVLGPLRSQRNRVVFNLVGGFKSVNAYLQTLGMVYAEEIVYIFESAESPLLRIPRLPLVFDEEPLKRYKGALVRLATGMEFLPREAVAGLPEVYLEEVEDLVCLSDWGLLAWNAVKEEVLGGELIVHPEFVYAESFARDYAVRREARERVALQEGLAKAALLWKKGGLKELRTDGGLLYESYRDRGEVGHFRIGQGFRVSCAPDGGRLCLRHYGPHDYVNDNP